jgi:hypothetical protein
VFKIAQTRQNVYEYVRASKENFMSLQIERWQALCEQASTEQDPAKLLELVQEINLLLEAEETAKPKSDKVQSTQYDQASPS